MERLRLGQPLLYLSAFFESRRDDYYRLLQRVRTHGDWGSWLGFFLEGVAVTANEGVERSRRLMDLRERFRRKLRGKTRALDLLDELFQNPYITVARAEKLLKVSNPTARAAVTALQSAGMLKEISGRAWGRLYLARPILGILEE